MKEARRLAEGRAMEIWQGDELITKLDPAKGTPGNLFRLFRKQTTRKGRH